MVIWYAVALSLIMFGLGWTAGVTYADIKWRQWRDRVLDIGNK